MTAPSAEDQVRFLTHVQRVLAEGQFVATYKYALLLALADLAVEIGDDTGSPLSVPTALIAEKFVHYYWRQSAPYATATRSTASVLRQNTGRQAAVLRELVTLQQQARGNLASLRSDGRRWKSLISEVRSVVVEMPLWKLQTVGRQPLEFLYGRSAVRGHIEFKPGACFCLRKFHALVVDLVQAAWTRRVRKLNPDVLESAVDLDEFLFGSARGSLSSVQPLLNDLQEGRCFYCHREIMSRTAHVDHFIPWTLYPVDLGHNFVLAHQACNGSKADRLAAEDHLSLWVERNSSHGDLLARELTTRSVACDHGVTMQIARWAYGRAEQSGSQVWNRGNDLKPLSQVWRDILAQN